MDEVASLVAPAAWSPWQPIEEMWSAKTGDKSPGLYRIRHQGSSKVLYLGQTGSPLYSRLSHLKAIYTATEMPYNDPHTVGPALWALFQDTKIPYEASVCPLVGISEPSRKGLECLAISLYRQEFKESPRFNFGRMPSGWSKSSGNNAQLVARGLRFRGERIAESTPNHSPGIAPCGPLGDTNAWDLEWGGHRWRDWCPLDDATCLQEIGLYRLRLPHQELGTLLYLGQGKVAARLAQHRKTATQTEAYRVECSWVLNPRWNPCQLLELENDLIAAYMLSKGLPPSWQFRNKSRRT